MYGILAIGRMLSQSSWWYWKKKSRHSVQLLFYQSLTVNLTACIIDLNAWTQGDFGSRRQGNWNPIDWSKGSIRDKSCIYLIPWAPTTLYLKSKVTLDSLFTTMRFGVSLRNQHVRRLVLDVNSQVNKVDGHLVCATKYWYILLVWCCMLYQDLLGIKCWRLCGWSPN